MDAAQLRRFCIAGRRKHDRRAFYAAAAVKIQRSCRSMEDDVNIQKNQIFTVKNFDYPEKTLKYKHIRRISD